jgi:hypothetical protein
VTGLAATLILLLYPGVIAFGYVLDPARSTLTAFQITYPGEHARPAVQYQAAKEDRGRKLIFVKLSVCALLLAVWISFFHFDLVGLGLRIRMLPRAIGIGFLASILLLGGRYAFMRLLVGSGSKSGESYMVRGWMGTWILIFIFSGVVEEIWRGLSINALKLWGGNDVTVVILTSIAFLFAHLSGIPSRVRGTRGEGLWETLVGVGLAILFIASGTVIVPYVASVLYYLVCCAAVRRQFSAT